MKRRIDDFRPYTAKQIAFLNRGKGIDVPDVQSAIEEVKSMIDETDHSHRGEGENSIQLGPNSKAYADYSIAIGSSAGTGNEAQRSIVLGNSSASRRSSVAIGDGASANIENGITIGKSAYSYGEGSDAISIGTSTFSVNRSIAIGSRAQATYSNTLAIGVDSQSNSENAVSIGRDAQTNASHSIAIGYWAQANSQRGIAIGPNSQANGYGGIALGDGAQANFDTTIAIGSDAVTGYLDSIAIGTGASAFFDRSIAIGSGAVVRADNAVAIGPGANTETPYTIVLGTPEHVVIIPGQLKVLGLKSTIAWIAPSDDIIHVMSSPIHANDGITQRRITLRNPGRYRIKGTIYADVNSWAKFDILVNDEPIVEPVFVSESSRAFSLDFTKDIGVNTTLIFRLEVDRISSDEPIPSAGRVDPIYICGTETDIGSGVIED